MADPVVNPLTEDLDFNGHRGVNALPSNLAHHYVTRGEFEGAVMAVVAAAFLKIAGDNQMLADLNLGGKKTINQADGVANSDGANIGQVIARVAAAVVESKGYTDTKTAQLAPAPNRLIERLTPGVYEDTVPEGVTKVWVEIASGPGGNGGGWPASDETYPPGSILGGPGARGRVVRAVLAVQPGQVMTSRVGGCGQTAVDWTFEGIGGPGGGGGGSASKFEVGEQSVTAGGGGGGGGCGPETPGDGGSGGAAGTAGAGPGGAAGTLGAGTENAGAGGIGAVGDGTPAATGGPGLVGTISSSPSTILDDDESWAFGADAQMEDGPAPGSNGYIRIRYYQP